MSALEHDRPFELLDVPMHRYLAKPVDEGVLEPRMRVEAGGTGGVRREAAGDRARNERGALLLQPLDQRPLLRHQRIDLRRLAVEEAGDGMLLVLGRMSDSCFEVHR